MGRDTSAILLAASLLGVVDEAQFLSVVVERWGSIVLNELGYTAGQQIRLQSGILVSVFRLLGWIGFPATAATSRGWWCIWW